MLGLVGGPLAPGGGRHRASPIRRADLGIVTVLELVGVAPKWRETSQLAAKTL
jgi:hypothetical protein